MTMIEEEKKVTFNESELEEYLQDIHNTGTFKLNYMDDGNKYSKSKHFGKTYSEDKRYAILTHFDYMHIEDLNRLSLSASYSRDSNFGIYFREFNALVFSNSYDMGNLKEKCNSIQVFTKDELLETVKEQLEIEFKQNRLHDLKRKYNNQNEIEFLAHENWNSIYRDIVLQKEYTREVVHSYWYENNVNWQTVYDYLREGSKFIKSFADYYCTEKEDNIKIYVQNLLARTLKAKEYRDQPLILKAQKVINLLGSELKEAKNIWVVDSTGEKIQVPNIVHIDSKEIVVGNSWSVQPRMLVNNINTIVYGRTSYTVWALLESPPPPGRAFSMEFSNSTMLKA